MMDWSELPSVVLVHIYSLLPRRDKIAAASTCKSWREPLFQVPFSPALNLTINHHETDGPRIQFLTTHFVHKITDLMLTFNPTNPNNLDIVETVLTQLESNRHIRSLKLRCSEDSLAKEVLCGSTFSALILRKHFIRKVLQPLIVVLKSRNSLETFSFPLINELVHFETTFYSILEKYKFYSVNNLFLATLRVPFKKRNTESSVQSLSSNVKLENIHRFANLQMLSLDHEILTDEMLSTLGTGNNFGGLKRLILLATQPNKHVSNTGWINFSYNNSNCGVRLTLLGNGVVFDHGSNFIFQAQNLTHFRALYCKKMRMPTLNSLVLWNDKSLEYIELVHGNYDWMDYISHPNDDEDLFLDPIIFAAWRCQNLHTLKIGFLYCGQSLVGIARLKGSALVNLEISRSKVIYHNIQQLSNEVSKALQRQWKPNEDPIERRKKPNIASKKFVHGLRVLSADENED